MRAAAALALGLLAAVSSAAAAPPAAAGREALSIPLDLAVEQDPLAVGDTLRLFGEEGRNQSLTLGVDTAPNCSPVQVVLAVPPVASAGLAYALDGSGALWELGKGFPKPVEQVAPGAVALLPGKALPAVLYPSKIRLPGGTEAALPLPAEGGLAVGSGWWVRGKGGAALLREDGAVVWTWKPEGLTPLCAAAADGLVYCGTSEGWLVALDASRGKVRWRYRCGGAVTAVRPLASGVLLAASDHTVRRVGRKGSLVWQYRLSARPAGTPQAAAGGWLVAELGGRAVALLEERDGKRRWGWTAPAGEILRPPAVVEDTACVLVSSGELHPTLWLLPLPAPKAEKAPRG